jgi:hypothetical protein
LIGCCCCCKIGDWVVEAERSESTRLSSSVDDIDAGTDVSLMICAGGDLGAGTGGRGGDKARGGSSPDILTTIWKYPCVGLAETCVPGRGKVCSRETNHGTQETGWTDSFSMDAYFKSALLVIEKRLNRAALVCSRGSLQKGGRWRCFRLGFQVLGGLDCLSHRAASVAGVCWQSWDVS